VLPLIITLAPVIGMPVASVTIPFISVCEKTVNAVNTSVNVNSNFFIDFIVLLLIG
jgi:hypothetical protein